MFKKIVNQSKFALIAATLKINFKSDEEKPDDLLYKHFLVMSY